MRKQITGIICIAGLALSGCIQMGKPISPDFGASVAKNFAAQVSNPEPATDAAPEGSGAQASNAAERFATDQVKDPSATSRSTTAEGDQ